MEFIQVVSDQYIHHIGIFASHKNAEDLAPDTNNKAKSLFLFYVIQLDYATKSQNLYKGARELFKLNPKFFTPEYILDLKDDKLTDLLKKHLKPRYINEALLRYKVNSNKLHHEYSGNPLTIFTKSSMAKEALKKTRAFRGFGPKIGNFFVRTIINTFNYTYPDIEEILPPVDVHDVRIAFMMGYLETDKMSAKNIKATKKLWSEACKESGVSWLTFDKALWLLGSEGKPRSKDDILKLLTA